MLYIPKHFIVQELVDPVTYKELRQNALWVMDDRLVWTVDAMREYYKKPITINNWYSKGQFSQRGFRPISSGTGAYYSQHRYGRAVDLDVEGVPAEEVRQNIKQRYKTVNAFKYITTLEANVNWVHIDCRNVDTSKGIFIVYP